MPNKENVIQAVLSLYDPSGTYSRHAGVVITSIFSNTRSKVNIIILHDTTLTDDNKRRFEQTAERWKQSVEFMDVSERIDNIAEDPDAAAAGHSRGTLFRLLIPDILDLPKIIYLDCDVVVNLDIADLWNVNIGDFSLAGVRNVATPNINGSDFRGKARRWILRYSPENYFNAGVLLMNLQKIRGKYSLVQDSRKFFKRYSFAACYTDQDFLNVLFHGDVLLIDDRFNYNYHYSSGAERSDSNRIYHFIAMTKPWKYPQKTPDHFLYWNTFLQSEWRDQLADAVAESADGKPISSFRSIECLSLLFQRGLYYLHLNYNGLWKGRWESFTLIAKELYYRFCETRKSA